MSINSQGFRGKEFPATKSEREYRIVTLGGSTTFGTGSTSDATTYPQLLEDILNTRLRGTGQTITVINAGVPGYTTAETLINLELRVLDLQPDLITVYHAYNDMKPNVRTGFSSDYSHWRRPLEPYGTYTLEYSRLFVKLRSLYSNILGVFSPSTARLTRQDHVSQEGIQAFRRNLGTIVSVARGRNIDVVLATYGTSLTPENVKTFPERFQFVWGYLPQFTFAGMIQAFHLYNQAIIEVAQQRQVPVARLAEQVPRDFEHFTDHVHLTDVGARRAAEAFADAIFPLLEQRLTGRGTDTSFSKDIPLQKVAMQE